MKQNDYFRGYEPAAFSSVNDFTSKETKEAFNWGYESGLDPTGGDGKYVELDGKPEAGVNLWPKESELPGFYEGIAKYYGHVCSLPKNKYYVLMLSRFYSYRDISSDSSPSPSPSQKTSSIP